MKWKGLAYKKHKNYKCFPLPQSILRSQLACFWLKFQSGSITIILKWFSAKGVGGGGDPLSGKNLLRSIYGLPNKMSKFTKCPHGTYQNCQNVPYFHRRPWICSKTKTLTPVFCHRSCIMRTAINKSVRQRVRTLRITLLSQQWKAYYISLCKLYTSVPYVQVHGV